MQYFSVKNFAKDKIACLYQNAYRVRVIRDRREKLYCNILHKIGDLKSLKPIIIWQ